MFYRNESKEQVAYAQDMFKTILEFLGNKQ